MTWISMFYQGSDGLVRLLVVGPLAYLALICFLRVSGKRTLAKLNAFDLVVTVALGSTLSAILLQKSIPLAEGTLALALLIAMQFIVTFVSVRSPAFASAIRSEPSLLARDGTYLVESMRRERVTEDEVHGAIRAAGGSDIRGVSSVVLETDGTISVQLGTDKVLIETH